jgi:aryl-alcohol dehydrogenase-like predicted oxidoreductase
MGFVLSGKFLTGENPKARLSLFPQYSRYSSEQSLAATKLYMKLLLKWFDSNRVSACFYSNLFNEYDYWNNNIRAVKENIDTINVTLSENVLKAINEVQAMIQSALT